MQENLHNLVQQKSLRSKEKIGSKLINELFESKEVSKKGGTVELTTGGPNKLAVSLNIKPNKVRFSHEDLKKMQVVMGQSDRGIQ